MNVIKDDAAGLVSARIGTPESKPGLAAPCFRPEWERRSSLIGVLADRNLLPIEIEAEEVNGGLISPAHGGGDGHAVLGGNSVFGRLDGAGRLHHALDRLANDLAPPRPMPIALMGVPRSLRPKQLCSSGGTESDISIRCSGAGHRCSANNGAYSKAFCFQYFRSAAFDPRRVFRYG